MPAAQNQKKMEKIERKVLSPYNCSYFILDNQHLEYYKPIIERFNGIDTSDLKLAILKKLIKENHSVGYYDGYISVEELDLRIVINYKITDIIYIPYILFSYDNNLVFVQNNAYITL